MHCSKICDVVIVDLHDYESQPVVQRSVNPDVCGLGIQHCTDLSE